MKMLLTHPEISVGDETICGTLLSPRPKLPGILFVHGWGGSQEQDIERAREISRLGCVCLTIDLRGHGRDADAANHVTRAQNLEDLLAAYDWLAARAEVDSDAIAVIAISYGAYLASILTAMRRVRWLSLRAPAIYRDEQWELPKRLLNADPALMAYRHTRIEASENRALRACARFGGDALIIESETDNYVPHTVIENYLAAFTHARSLTLRLLAGADHALSTESARNDYTAVLINWITEMIGGARNDAAKSQLENKFSAEHVLPRH